MRLARRTTSQTRWWLAIVGIGVGLVSGLCRLGVGDDAAERAEPAARPRLGVLIHFEGAISPLLEQYLYRKLDQAREQGADVVVIEIDSPGGMLAPSLRCAEMLRETKWARTIAFVPREALSGGAIVALGCDDLIMGPEAKFGDAGPIYMNEGGLFQHAPEKIRSHLAAHVRDLATAKGRPPALAEAMVDKDLEVFQCRHKVDGKEWFLSDREIQSSVKPDDWEKIAPVLESLGGNFLEVNGKRAVELRLAVAAVNDREALREHLGLDTPWIVLERGAKDWFVFVLNLPLVTGLLLVVGLVALFIELSSPGIGVGGLVSLLCFSLFFWSRFLGGTSGWLEVVLFVVGGVFLAVELFLLPGFGVAGITGIVLMLVSLLMASQDFVVPSSRLEWVSLSQGVVVLVGAICGFLVTAALLSRHLGSLPIFGRLVLAAPVSPEAMDASGKKWFDPQGKPLADGAVALAARVQVGDWGVAVTPLRPAGKARFHSELIDVVTEGEFVQPGRQVRVTEAQASRIVVSALPDQPAS